MNDEQLLRYSRQIMLPEIDIAGQNRLLNSRVLIVGVGGLGCPAAIYLAASGVGTITLADPDRVDLSNLQRQIAFTTDDIGKPKVSAAASRIHAVNPDVQCRTIDRRLSEAELAKEVQSCDLILDATDRFVSRFAINRCSVASRKPLITGAAIQWRGQLALFDHRWENSPCYRCLYSDSADDEMSCSESSILGPVVGIIGTMQALEAIKLLTGSGQSADSKLLLFDALTTDWKQLALPKDPACPVCSS